MKKVAIQQFSNRGAKDGGLRFELEESCSVEEVKQRIVQEQFEPHGEVPALDRLKLIYRGSILENGRTVGDLLKEVEQATFHLVVRPDASSWDEPVRPLQPPPSMAHVPAPAPTPTPTQSQSQSQQSDARSTSSTSSGTSTDTESTGSSGASTQQGTRVAFVNLAASPQVDLNIPPGEARLVLPGNNQTTTFSTAEMILTTDIYGDAVFCMSPSVVSKVRQHSNVGFPSVMTVQAQVPASSARVLRDALQNIFNTIVEFGRQYADLFFLVARLFIFVQIFALQIQDRFTFWVVTLFVVTVVVLQSQIGQDHLRPVLDTRFARLRLNLPQGQNNGQQQQHQVQRNGIVNRVTQGLIMFVSSLFPAIHDDWARRQGDAERLLQQQEDRNENENDANEEGQNQVQNDESGQSASRYENEQPPSTYESLDAEIKDGTKLESSTTSSIEVGAGSVTSRSNTSTLGDGQDATHNEAL